MGTSCTEQRRWSYASQVFQESGNVMAHKSRARKARSVQCSLEASGVHKSNQDEVWQDIAALQAKACAPSSTSAMSDVFKSREEDLKKCTETFQCVPDQVGLLAIVDGQPAGLDMVSRSSAYTRIHPKLVRSYTLEGLLDAAGKTVVPDALTASAQDFLAEISAAEQRQFPSVGYGTDVRFKAKALTGTALVHDNEIIQAAFFRLVEQEEPGKIASLGNRRRRFRESDHL